MCSEANVGWARCCAHAVGETITVTITFRLINDTAWAQQRAHPA